MKALKNFYGENIDDSTKRYYKKGDTIKCKDAKTIAHWVKLGLCEAPPKKKAAPKEKKAGPTKAKKEGKPTGAK